MIIQPVSSDNSTMKQKHSKMFSAPSDSSNSEDDDTVKPSRGADRKRRRGIIEKRRRDRINNSLIELKRLVPAAFEKQGSTKLEKAEILQLTVEHLKFLQQSGPSPGYPTQNSQPQNGVLLEYHTIGFSECMSEVMRYLTLEEGFDQCHPLHTRLLRHLHMVLGLRRAQYQQQLFHHHQQSPSFTPSSASAVSGGVMEYPPPGVLPNSAVTLQSQQQQSWGTTSSSCPVPTPAAPFHSTNTSGTLHQAAPPVSVSFSTSSPSHPHHQSPVSKSCSSSKNSSTNSTSRQNPTAAAAAVVQVVKTESVTHNPRETQHNDFIGSNESSTGHYFPLAPAPSSLGPHAGVLDPNEPFLSHLFPQSHQHLAYPNNLPHQQHQSQQPTAPYYASMTTAPLANSSSTGFPMCQTPDTSANYTAANVTTSSFYSSPDEFHASGTKLMWPDSGNSLAYG